jgi:hypothetical protein
VSQDELTTQIKALLQSMAANTMDEAMSRPTFSMSA